MKVAFEEAEDLSLSQLMHAVPEDRSIQVPGGPQLHRKGKVINDPIHRHFRLGPEAVRIMDSSQFQRLRELKQLGLSYYVFPGASHNRFEHCLGVAHLANQLAMHFKFGQPSLRITANDLKIVEIAGLCHDLGHGPFSHVFDYNFLKTMGIKDWSHEEMSVAILDTIIEDAGLIDDGLSQEDVERIKAMILAGSSGRQFLHEIVANGRNGLDVDKYDYLLRDAHQCGVPIAVDINRLKTFSRVGSHVETASEVVEDEICYKVSEYHNVMQVFQARAYMHQRVYGNRKAKAIEHMVVDALIAAEPVLKLTERVHDPRQFVTLDDSVLRHIELFGEFDSSRKQRSSYKVGQVEVDLEDLDDSHIAKAQHILRRLRKRDLYKCCGQFNLPPLDPEGWREPRPLDIAGYLPSSSGVTHEDIVVTIFSINLTAGNRNPLDNVGFYDCLDSDCKRQIRGTDMTNLILANNEERMIRIYCKKSDAKSVSAVEEAASGFIKGTFGSQVICNTPRKTQPPTALAVGNGLTDTTRKRKLTFVM